MSAISVVFGANISTLNVPDGVVIDVLTGAANASLNPEDITAVAYVGTSTFGPFDTVGFLGDPTTGANLYGLQTVNATDLMTFANLALLLGITDIRTVRIGDGTQVPAILPIMGALAAFVTLVGKYPGSLLNNATAKLRYNALTPIAMQQTSGNAAKVYVDLTISIPTIGVTEIFQMLDGNLVVVANGVTTYSIDPTVLGNAIASAVMTGVPNGRGASNYFIASNVSAAGGAPLVGVSGTNTGTAGTNTVSSLGTDGAAFAAGAPKTLDQAMLGVQANINSGGATGMYALGGNLSGAALCLCGCFDIATVGNLMLNFAKAQNGHAIMSFPSGVLWYGTNGLIAQKNMLGLADFGATVFNGDLCEVIDNVNGAIHRWVDPSPLAAARYAFTPVNLSPANLFMNGIMVGTQRVGSLGNNPYGDDESLALENAGINFFSNDTAGGVGFAIRHNKNSLGKNAGYRGNMAYSHMTQFLIDNFKTNLLGQLVGKDQRFKSSDDKTRAGARSLFMGFLGDLETDEVIDSSTVVCDLTNNSPGKGLLRVDVTVDYNEIVDAIAVGFAPGVGLVAQVTPVSG